jgi:Coenzyme PQQ synthesis protein D (PqqD)
VPPLPQEDYLLTTVPTSVPKVKEDLVFVEIDGESVVLDRVSGNLHHLNATASALFVSCDGQVTEAELVAELAEVFGAPADVVARDVAMLLEQFHFSGLFEGDSEGCADCGGPSPQAPTP